MGSRKFTVFCYIYIYWRWISMTNAHYTVYVYVYVYDRIGYPERERVSRHIMLRTPRHECRPRNSKADGWSVTAPSSFSLTWERSHIVHGELLIATIRLVTGVGCRSDNCEIPLSSFFLSLSDNISYCLILRIPFLLSFSLTTLANVGSWG